jgi:hypothetical protein
MVYSLEPVSLFESFFEARDLYHAGLSLAVATLASLARRPEEVGYVIRLVTQLS